MELKRHEESVKLVRVPHHHSRLCAVDKWGKVAWGMSASPQRSDSLRLCLACKLPIAAAMQITQRCMQMKSREGVNYVPSQAQTWWSLVWMLFQSALNITLRLLVITQGNIIQRMCACVSVSKKRIEYERVSVDMSIFSPCRWTSYVMLMLLCSFEKYKQIHKSSNAT